MVGHLTSPHYLSFSEEDDFSLSHPHNQPLHIEVLIGRMQVCHILIDNGASLNISFASLLT
jgi:ankyrin repeat protein